MSSRGNSAWKTPTDGRLADRSRDFHIGEDNPGPKSTGIPRLGAPTGAPGTLTVADRPSSSLGAGDPFYLLTPDLAPINAMPAGWTDLILSTTMGDLYKVTGIDATDMAMARLYAGGALAGDEAVANIGNDVAFGRNGRIETLFSIQGYGDVEAFDLSRPIANRIAGVAGWTLVYDRRAFKLYCFPAERPEVWVYHRSLSDDGNRRAIRQGSYGALIASPWSVYRTAHPLGFQPSCAWSMRRPTDGLICAYMGDAAGNLYQLEGAGGLDGGTAPLTVERLSKLFGLPDGVSYDVTGFIHYRSWFDAAVRVQFEWAGSSQVDQPIDLVLPAAGPSGVWGGGWFWGGGAPLGVRFAGRLSRLPLNISGRASHLQCRVTVTGGADFFIDDTRSFRANDLMFRTAELQRQYAAMNHANAKEAADHLGVTYNTALDSMRNAIEKEGDAALTKIQTAMPAVSQMGIHLGHALKEAYPHLPDSTVEDTLSYGMTKLATATNPTSVATAAAAAKIMADNLAADWDLNIGLSKKQGQLQAQKENATATTANQLGTPEIQGRNAGTQALAAITNGGGQADYLKSLAEDAGKGIPLKKDVDYYRMPNPFAQGGGSPRPAAGDAPAVPDDVRATLDAVGRKYSVDPALLWGVMGQESGFGADPSTSSAGAQGPFQFIPETARRYGLTNPNDFAASADAAGRYLGDLIGRNNGSVSKALTQYGGFSTKDPTAYINGVAQKAKTYAPPAAPAPGGAPVQGPQKLVSGQSGGQIKYDEAQAAALVERHQGKGGYVDAGNSAAGSIFDLHLMADAARGFASGQMAPLNQEVRRIAGSATGKPLPETSSYQEFAHGAVLFAAKAAAEMASRVTNFDFKTFMDALPNAQTDPVAMARLIDQLYGVARYALDRRDDYLRTKPKSPEAAMSWEEQFNAAHPLESYYQGGPNYHSAPGLAAPGGGQQAPAYDRATLEAEARRRRLPGWLQ